MATARLYPDDYAMRRRTTQRPSGRTVAAITLAWIGFCCVSLAGESASTNFRLKQMTVNAGGNVSQSAGFRLEFSQGQETTVGTSASTGYIVQAGFWGAFGSGLVPVILYLDKDTVVRDNAALTWSGNNSPYELYRGSDCTSVTTSPWTTVSGNTQTETSPPVATLLCYSVFATAPGPEPPPGGE